MAILVIYGLKGNAGLALTVTGPRRATVVGVSFDAFTTIEPLSGMLRVNVDGYDVKIDDLAPVPLTIEGCPFEFYWAHARGIIPPASISVDAARRAVQEMGRTSSAPLPTFTRDLRVTDP